MDQQGGHGRGVTYRPRPSCLGLESPNRAATTRLGSSSIEPRRASRRHARALSAVKVTVPTPPTRLILRPYSARHEVAQQLGKPLRLVQVRVVPGTLEQLDPTAGDCLMSGRRVADWDHPVPRSPHHEGGDLDGQR